MRTSLALVLALPLLALAQSTQVEVTPPPGKAPPPAAAAPDKPLTADEAFQTRVRTLEEQVTDLKEKVFRTKARLMLLQETVLGGDVSAGARAVIFHRNEMGGSFVLESAQYLLDGAPIYTRTDADGDLSRRTELEIFNGRIIPGQHQLAVRLTYRGHGYGLFSYLDGYKFKVTSSHTFNAEAGKVTLIKAVGFEKGGVTTELKDKPSVRYDIEVIRDAAMRNVAPPVAAPPPTP